MNRRMETLIPEDEYGNEPAERQETWEDLTNRIDANFDDLFARIEVMERRLADLLNRKGGAW